MNYLIDLLKMSGNFTSYLDGETPWENGVQMNEAAFSWNAALDGNCARRVERAYKRAAILGGRRSDVVMTKEQFDHFVQAVVIALNGEQLTPFWQCVIAGVAIVRA